MAVTIAHYPTGASKWNPIEHRLFSETQELRGRATRQQRKDAHIHSHNQHKTGLTVTAYLDRNEYPTRLKPDPLLISSLRITYGKMLRGGTTLFDPICEIILASTLRTAEILSK
jgi:hypothetical protein